MFQLFFSSIDISFLVPVLCYVHCAFKFLDLEEMTLCLQYCWGWGQACRRWTFKITVGELQMLSIGLWCWGICLGWPGNTSWRKKSSMSSSWGNAIAKIISSYVGWIGVIKFTNIFRSLLQVKKGQNLQRLPELFKVMKHIHLSPTLILGHPGLLLPVLMKEGEKLQVDIISSHL